MDIVSTRKDNTGFGDSCHDNCRGIMATVLPLFTSQQAKAELMVMAIASGSHYPVACQ